MKKIKITVLSQKDFDSYMEEHDINETNVSEVNKIFVSIIGTEECLNYYLDEKETKHYFPTDRWNLLNLDFDDLDKDLVYDGHLFKAMSDEQALRACLFFEKLQFWETNKYDNENFDEIIIHCRCGVSRSRAIAEYLCQMYSDRCEFEYNERDRFYSHINHCVLRKIKQMYREYVEPQYNDDLTWQDSGIIAQELMDWWEYKGVTHANYYAERYDAIATHKIENKYKISCSFLTLCRGHKQRICLHEKDNETDDFYHIIKVYASNNDQFHPTNPFEKAISEYFQQRKGEQAK